MGSSETNCLVEYVVAKGIVFSIVWRVGAKQICLFHWQPWNKNLKFAATRVTIHIVFWVSANIGTGEFVSLVVAKQTLFVSLLPAKQIPTFLYSLIPKIQYLIVTWVDTKHELQEKILVSCLPTLQLVYYLG